MIARKNLSLTLAIMFLGIGITSAIDAGIIAFQFNRDWEWYSSYVGLIFLMGTILLFMADFDNYIEKRFGASRNFGNRVWYIAMTCFVLTFIAIVVKWYVRHGNQFSF